METKIVTRHRGAVKWIKKHYPEYRHCKVLPRASRHDVAGHRIIGILPSSLCRLPAEYYYLHVPNVKSGEELTCEQLEVVGCQLKKWE